MFILVIIIRFVLLAIFMVYQLNNFSLSISQFRTSRGPLQNAFTRFSVMVLVSSADKVHFSSLVICLTVQGTSNLANASP